MGEEAKKKQRPGRRVAAEKRRLAREVIRDFYGSEEFAKLPNAVQVALLTICPRKDSHPQPAAPDAEGSL